MLFCIELIMTLYKVFTVPIKLLAGILNFMIATVIVQAFYNLSNLIVLKEVVPVLHCSYKQN
jgi:hypothetical protein